MIEDIASRLGVSVAFAKGILGPRHNDPRVLTAVLSVARIDPNLLYERILLAHGDSDEEDSISLIGYLTIYPEGGEVVLKKYLAKIMDNMRGSGVAVEGSLELAYEYEGIRELFLMWNEEIGNEVEQAKTIAAIQELVRDCLCAGG